ncbi:hypothetical protein LLS04_04175 [Erysipelothrix enhydrae]|uniref:hypothetical protein n=1 Tax=Erysipelothrix enhydrae TaxID=2890314 RepID=UPI002B24433D|nr:hypothetical protein [Erysipelothrix sp. 4322-04]WRB87778.1 hypothetical protein LLS04_04175 [Erysipelothrix sp. 4322-04]
MKKNYLIVFLIITNLCSLSYIGWKQSQPVPYKSELRVFVEEISRITGESLDVIKDEIRTLAKDNNLNKMEAAQIRLRDAILSQNEHNLFQE